VRTRCSTWKETIAFKTSTKLSLSNSLAVCATSSFAVAAGPDSVVSEKSTIYVYEVDVK
jgi:hypothetical protein